MTKYFLAVVPPKNCFFDIENIKQNISEKYHIKGALLSPAHITLHMPFSFDEQAETKLIDTIKQFKFDEQITIQLKNYSTFEPRVIFINVLENENLFNFQKKLVQFIKSKFNIFNQADDLRGFHPHVTIAYRDLKKPIFYAIWEEYQQKKFENTFLCESFWLLKQTDKKWEQCFEFKISLKPTI